MDASMTNIESMSETELRELLRNAEEALDRLVAKRARSTLKEANRSVRLNGGQRQEGSMHLDRKTSFTAALVTAALGASPAYAHTFGATGAGFVDGFGHIRSAASTICLRWSRSACGQFRPEAAPCGRSH